MTPSERSHEPRATKRWQHGAAPVIGLTGALASGKSAVARLLADRGFVLINADSVGHAVLELPEVKRQLRELFGARVLAGEGVPSDRGSGVDRKALAAIVFADPEARRALEAMVHPLMRARFVEAIEHELDPARPAVSPVVLDAAILLEAGWDDLCDLVVFVDAPRSDRIYRAAMDRGWNAKVFFAREGAQWPSDQKRLRADFVIKNDAGLDALPGEVDRLVTTLLDPVPASSRVPGLEPTSAEPRAPGRRGQEGSGSGAWQDDPCPIL